MKKNKAPQKEIYLQRIKCNCIAQKHELINNCLSCGKIVCAQEGQGPCLYCGNLVTKPDGKYITNDQSLFPSLSKQQLTKVSQERSKAILHKNTLVDRDKSTNMGQNIYDESVDYYDVSENQWLDEQSRQSAIDRILDTNKFVENQKFKQKIVFDPLTGKFVTEQFSFNEESFRQEGKNFMENQQRKQYEKKMSTTKVKYDNRLMANEKVKEIISEIKTHPDEKTRKKNKPKEDEIKKRNHVVQLINEEEQNQEISNVEVIVNNQTQTSSSGLVQQSDSISVV